MTRAPDRHLDDHELDGLVSPQIASASESEPLSEHTLEEVRSHLEFCADCRLKVQSHHAVQSKISNLSVSRTMLPGPDCDAAVDWLGVAAGLLPEPKARELLQHAAQCGHCGPKLKRASALLADEATPAEEAAMASLLSAGSKWQRQMAETLRTNSAGSDIPKIPRWGNAFVWPRTAYASAAVAALLVIAWVGLQWLVPPSAEKLLAQAYTERRTLEVRIPGAKYAPVRVERAAGGSDLDKPVSLLKAEAIIGEKLRSHPSDPAWLQAKGRADLLNGSYESAIYSLQLALEQRADSAKLLTDLGSAYFLRAESTDRPVDYGNAIEQYGKALSIRSDDLIALFNRALASERMSLYSQAVDDWQHYLRLDPNGDWATEARRHLDVLQEKIKKHGESTGRPLLEPSALARFRPDDDLTLTSIDQRLEEYLGVAVSEWLPKAYPLHPGKSNDSTDIKASLQIIAQVAERYHGDPWLLELLSNSAFPQFPAAVAELSSAAKADETGDNVSSRLHALVSEKLFAAAGNDAGALRARVEVIFAARDAGQGEPCSHAAQGVGDRLLRHSYVLLTIQFDLEEGSCRWLMGDIGAAQRLYVKAEKGASASKYPSIYLRTQDHLSTLSAETGDLATTAVRSSTALDQFWAGQYPAMRGYNLYYNLYEWARLANQPHLQMSVWRDGLRLSDSFHNAVLRAWAHAAMADAALSAKQYHLAKQEFSTAADLFGAAPQIASTRLAMLEVESRLAQVEVIQGQAQKAVTRLRPFTEEASQLSDAFVGILFYTTLGQAESRCEHDREAGTALQSAVALAELQLQTLKNDDVRIEWQQHTETAYREFTALRLRQGDTQGALETWEFYRGAAPRSGSASSTGRVGRSMSVQQSNLISSRLPALTNTTVISYALLPKGLAIWVFDNRGVFAHWSAVSPDQIKSQARHFRNLCADPRSDLSALQRAGRALYDLLVAPLESHMSAERALLIEPDEGLGDLPFDALLDARGHYLSERGPLAASLGMYYSADGRARIPIKKASPALIVAIATAPAPLSLHASPLPDALSEGEMVAREFNAPHFLSAREASSPSILSFLPQVSVFHFAGHASTSPRQAGLLLSDSSLSASVLGRTSLSKLLLAVFSACDTQAGSEGTVYDPDGLVRVFLRAGVPNVVASRWNVDSVASRHYMELFYGALLRGGSVAESMQSAETGLRMQPGTAHPYYWASFSNFSLI